MQQEQGLGNYPAPNAPEPRARRRYRSLFWAVVLIGIGVLALLFNLDVIAPANLGVLTLLWPILLIGIGADLLIGRRSPLLGGLVGVVTIGLIIVFMFVGSNSGWAGKTDMQTQTFNTMVGQATSARVFIDTDAYSAKVHALETSTAATRPLLGATLTYRGSVEFTSSGDLEKDVRLETKGQTWWWQWLDPAGDTPWDIGLDPGLPLDLSIESSSGDNELDLSGLHLAGLKVDMSSGDVRVLLPAPGQVFGAALHLSSGDLEVQARDGSRADMSVDMSSGDARIGLGAGSEVTITFNGSSGEFTLELAPGQALRVEVKQVSSGDVKLPSGLARVTQGDGEEGTWESQGYANAAQKVLLIIEHISSGSVSVKQGG